MKSKNVVIFGIIIITIMIIITVVGCVGFQTSQGTTLSPTFPPELRGTWKRVDSIYDNTLTITSNTHRPSQHHPIYAILESVSGNVYTMSLSIDRSQRVTETIRFVNGNLVIESCGNTGIDDCAGVWVKQ